MKPYATVQECTHGLPVMPRIDIPVVRRIAVFFPRFIRPDNAVQAGRCQEIEPVIAAAVVVFGSSGGEHKNGSAGLACKAFIRPRHVARGTDTAADKPVVDS